MSDSFVLSAIGLIVAIGGGAIAHLYMLMFRLQERSDLAVAGRFKEVAELIRRLEQRIETERETLTETRLRMVVKEDLKDQTANILREIDRRVAWTKTPGRHPLND